MKVKSEIYGFGFDFWIFSVSQKYDEHKLPIIDKLKYEAVTYNGIDSFAFPLCDGEGGFYNVTSYLDECGGTLFIRELPTRNKDYF